MNAGLPIAGQILGVPFGGTTGQILTGVTGAAPAWSNWLNGNLGLGRAPLYPLTVKTATDNVLSLVDGGAGNGVYLYAHNDANSNVQKLNYQAAQHKFSIGSGNTLALLIDAAGNCGIGVTPTAGNGLLQLAAGTTKANGIAFGTDSFLYRYTTAGLLCSAWFKCGDGTQVQSSILDGIASGAGGGARFRLQNSGTDIGQIGNISAFTGSSYDSDFGILASGQLKLYSGNSLAVTIDTSQNLTAVGKLKANSAAASSTLTGNTVAQVITWLQTVFQ